MAEPVRTDPDRDRRRRRGGWLWWLLVLLAAVIVLIIVLAARGCGSDDDNNKSNSAGNTNAQTATNSGGGSTTSATSSGSNGSSGTNGSSGSNGSKDASTGGSAGGAGVLTSQSTNLLGRSPSTLARFVGKPVSGRAVKVVAVVGDEVFWVGSSTTDRVLVHLRTSGESPPKVRAGDHATFTGALAKNAAGAAGSYGVTEREGAALLRRQGVHVETNVSTLKLSR